ncbi:hypothetical protein jpw_15775 [Pseudomonas asiatica]|uniref:hypothetical protein n=1 Tax=Pseudomonas asiatica TaxID=2219225 RepID=UPI0021F6FA8D|nr:hypothetical protein [Pseudomonas asiatica]UYP80753.1 hypothetical protein jpw_15775 [Pseudomonas asiatica]
MIKDLFAPRISFWQHSVTMVALIATWAMGFTPWAVPVFLGIVILGGAVEGAVEALA